MIWMTSVICQLLKAEASSFITGADIQADGGFAQI